MAVLKEVAHWRLKEAGEHTEPHPEAYCILCSLLKSEKYWRLEDSPARHPPVLLAFFPINLLLVHATTITGWRGRLRCDNLPPSKVTSASQATNKKFTTVCAVLRLRQKNNRQSAETEGGSRGSRRFSSEEETGLSVREKKAVNLKIRRQQPRKLKAHMQGKTNNASVSSLGIKNILSEVTGLLMGNYSLWICHQCPLLQLHCVSLNCWSLNSHLQAQQIKPKTYSVCICQSRQLTYQWHLARQK